ncbi:monofunctional biosynthetic peptidoglycan transglycosylase [Terrimonas sp.]|uniref:monofunctional biosynthetic peptidoglycan transglycosylase n=1 Tax=Terrimonas sp. TaxID=1914338 RepID=UPI000D524E54|nr:monofunctional biosynthetic peptidoglycan transglycosylase [Terrimonas sp.]PVD49657.1 monofunctional biosynthetic peptidoglycan transglycosylase [Terrimonas sp.]
MKHFFSRVWQFLKRLFLILLIAQFVYIIVLKWVNPPVTITQIGSLLSGNGLKRDYVDAEHIASNAGLAVIASEDQLFPDHNGFDWKSIQKAIEKNKKKQNRIRGASTISQQVAKNVFLWQGRDWLRKGLEVYFTFMIELIWGKERILEVYLNVAEMGKGIFGIEAAAQNYFKKPAAKLSRTEAAMIAACLPNPVQFSVKPISRFVAARYPWILIQMSNLDGDPDIIKVLPGKKKVSPSK